MGTHPIFESDFDCLTEYSRRAHAKTFCHVIKRMKASKLFVLFGAALAQEHRWQPEGADYQALCGFAPTTLLATYQLANAQLVVLKDTADNCAINLSVTRAAATVAYVPHQITACVGTSLPTLRTAGATPFAPTVSRVPLWPSAL